MGKLSTIKEKLQNILLAFSVERATTDKGILEITKVGDEIAVGDTVKGIDNEGNAYEVANGDYIFEDKVLTIVDQVITEIKLKEAEETEQPAAAADETVTEELAEENAEETEQPAEPTVDELKAKIAQLEKENADLIEKVAELQKKLDETPAAESAKEEFSQAYSSVKSNNDKRTERLMKFVGVK